MKTDHIAEVSEVWDYEGANKLLAEGWELVSFYTRKDEHGEYPRFVLGKRQPAGDRIEELMKAWDYESANRLLAEGWELLLSYTIKDECGENPRFILGFRS